MPENRNEFRCTDCGEQDASYIMVWEKMQQETGLKVWSDPEMICEDCRQEKYGKDALFDLKPVLVSFEKLADAKVVGWLIGKKGKESNQLSVPFWKKKLWQMHHIASYYKSKEEAGNDETKKGVIS